jgi:hypothetical protein
MDYHRMVATTRRADHGVSCGPAALVRAGEATLAKWDTMSQSQQDAALEASETWPQEAPLPEDWPELRRSFRHGRGCTV